MSRATLPSPLYTLIPLQITPLSAARQPLIATTPFLLSGLGQNTDQGTPHGMDSKHLACFFFFFLTFLCEGGGWLFREQNCSYYI